MAKNVLGSFRSRAEAVAAVQVLRQAGFAEDSLGLLARDEGDNDPLKHDLTGTKLEEGAGLGAAAGAVTGVGLGLAVAVGFLPPLGPAIAGGTLMGLLASAGSGATVGTVVGGLVGLGVPEDEVAYYRTQYDAGRTLVAVRADARAREAEEILRRQGGRVWASGRGT